jgi:short-subunit dehydrogenase
MGTGRRGAVVIGASSGVGRALADSLGRAGYDLVLAARSTRDLAAVAADVRARHSVRAIPLELDLAAPGARAAEWFERCRSALPDVDAVLITAGAVDDHDDGITDDGLVDHIVGTNFVGVVRVAQLFLADFERRDRGTLVLCSTIATAAPRRHNVLYTAAKSALESYARSVQHRYADSGVRVQVVALGYVDTAMTRGRRLLLPVARPSRVADDIVDHLYQSRRFRYSPGFWALVTAALRRLPWPLYKRLEF